MDSLNVFLDMGGYGQFVWPAYGVTAVVLVILMIASRRSLKSAEATLAAFESGQATNRTGAAE
jgi:heme exporter protein D